MSEPTKITQAELYELLCDRFGKNPANWAFTCPSCHDTATVTELQEALDANPRRRSDDTKVESTEIIGQECIGRSIGALANPPTNDRGCHWVAFGLIRGPWEIVLPDGNSMWCFPVADTTAVSR